VSLFGDSDLVKRIAALEAEVASLKLGMEEQLDKTYRWMQRANARARRQEDAPVVAQGGQTIDPVSARLLARRSRNSHVPRPVLPEAGQLGFDGDEVK
jgi:hypothetical protein